MFCRHQRITVSFRILDGASWVEFLDYLPPPFMILSVKLGEQFCPYFCVCVADVVDGEADIDKCSRESKSFTSETTIDQQANSPRNGQCLFTFFGHGVLHKDLWQEEGTTA